MGSNFKGAFFTVQKALSLLRDGAAIVMNTSVADKIGFAQPQRLFGEQGSAAVVDSNAGGGTARSKDPGERRRPWADTNRHHHEGAKIS